jgi:hypothetical protein
MSFKEWSHGQTERWLTKRDQRLCSNESLIFSAAIITGILVLAVGKRGMAQASAT